MNPLKQIFPLIEIILLAAGLVVCSAQFSRSSPLVNTDALHICQGGQAAVVGSPLMLIARGPSLPMFTYTLMSFIPQTRKEQQLLHTGGRVTLSRVKGDNFSNS